MKAATLALLKQTDPVAASCGSEWLGINLYLALPVRPHWTRTFRLYFALTSNMNFFRPRDHLRDHETLLLRRLLPKTLGRLKIDWTKFWLKNWPRNTTIWPPALLVTRNFCGGKVKNAGEKMHDLWGPWAPIQASRTGPGHFVGSRLRSQSIPRGVSPSDKLYQVSINSLRQDQIEKHFPLQCYQGSYSA